MMVVSWRMMVVSRGVCRKVVITKCVLPVSVSALVLNSVSLGRVLELCRAASVRLVEMLGS